MTQRRRKVRKDSVNPETRNQSMYRREFIKKTALSAGALSLASGSLYKACAQDEKKLGIALVGLGNYATNKLAPALMETQHVELRGIVTGTPEKATKWKAKYNIPDKNIYNYETFNQIADNDDIDVVYIVLPNCMHAEYTIRALEAGKHTICEKPMACSVVECEQMVAASKKAGKQLAIGYRLHYEPFTKEVMRLQREQDMGPVKFFEGGFGFRLTDKKRWRIQRALSGGGPMMDVGIYVVQAAQYAIGEQPIAVTAQSVKTQPEIFDTVEETLMFQMEFPGGAMASCTTSYAANTEYMRISYEKGWVYMSPAYSYGPIQGKTNKQTIDLPHTNHQALHMDGVCLDFKNGNPNIVPGEMGLRDMKIVEAVYEAMETGKRVKLSWA